MRVVQKEKKPTKEATLELILKRLKEKRVERCLPEDIKVNIKVMVWPFLIREGERVWSDSLDIVLSTKRCLY